MNKTPQTVGAEMEGDLVLREVWRAKDALSAARGHSIDKLFADMRKREKKSGHPVVNLQTKRRKA
jgi:phosphopantetheinyl transferase (holo-ACP synthase)